MNLDTEARAVLRSHADYAQALAEREGKSGAAAALRVLEYASGRSLAAIAAELKDQLIVDQLEESGLRYETLAAQLGITRAAVNKAVVRHNRRNGIGRTAS